MTDLARMHYPTQRVMVSSMNDGIVDDEEYDSFVLDPASLAVVDSTVRADGGRGRGGRAGGSRASSRSAATTLLATEVGSTVGARQDPFLKSITFFDPKIYFRRNGEKGNGDTSEKGASRRRRSGAAPSSDSEGVDGDDGDGSDDDAADDLTCEVNDLSHWDIMLKDPQAPGEAPRAAHRQSGGLRGKIRGRLGRVGDGFKKKGPQLIVEDFEGIVEYSSLEAGDRLVSINKKKIRPADFSAEYAMAFMRERLEKEGVLHVTTENPSGKDVIVNITVIKPRPAMTYDQLGLIVWNWSFLCVREVKDGSIFQHTAVQETDQIAAINDIDCSKMNEEKFARCVNELPTEITITLIRRKHRYTGSYT